MCVWDVLHIDQKSNARDVFRGNAFRTMRSNVEPLCFLLCSNEEATETTVEEPVIWDAMTLKWRRYNKMHESSELNKK